MTVEHNNWNVKNLITDNKRNYNTTKIHCALWVERERDKKVKGEKKKQTSTLSYPTYNEAIL